MDHKARNAAKYRPGLYRATLTSFSFTTRRTPGPVSQNSPCEKLAIELVFRVGADLITHTMVIGTHGRSQCIITLRSIAGSEPVPYSINQASIDAFLRRFTGREYALHLLLNRRGTPEINTITPIESVHIPGFSIQ